MGMRLGKDLGRFRIVLCQRLVAVFYDSPHDFHFLLREVSGLPHFYERLLRRQILLGGDLLEDLLAREEHLVGKDLRHLLVLILARLNRTLAAQGSLALEKAQYNRQETDAQSHRAFLSALGARERFLLGMSFVLEDFPSLRLSRIDVNDPQSTKQETAYLFTNRRT